MSSLSEMSCDEARIALCLIPPKKSKEKFSSIERSAVDHYEKCPSCRWLGLPGIWKGKGFSSCYNAVLEWARRPFALWTLEYPNLFSLWAVEHVWGRHELQNDLGGRGWNESPACREQSCDQLRRYWSAVPMSSSAGDGSDGVIRLYPVLYWIFSQKGWPLHDLVSIQTSRLEAVINDIRTGRVTTGGGHIHTVDELLEEARQHLSLFRELVSDWQNQSGTPGTSKNREILP